LEHHVNYPYSSPTFARLGVRSWINAENWSTAIGGAHLDDRVVAAMRDAAGSFCDMFELTERANARIAELCQVDSAYLTAGAASAIVLATAACVTGPDQRRILQLSGAIDGRESLANEVIMQIPHSSHYDYQYVAGGARLVRVGSAYRVTAGELEAAISEKTVCITYVNSYHNAPRDLPFAAVSRIAHRYDVPLFVDSAAILPPRVNLHRFIDEGADLVAFSGGKAIRAPGNTGILVAGAGRGRRLMDAIRMQSYPNYGIGRAFKVNKESVAGFVTALEIFLATDEQDEYRTMLGCVERLKESLSARKGLDVRVIPNDDQDFEHPISARVPRLYLEWDPRVVGFDAARLDELLAAGDPPIRLRKPQLTQDNTVTSRSVRLVDPYSLRPEEETILVERLLACFPPA
jgi:L-seryl-tRNA(Ser) seleniumtransferase